MAVSVFTRTNAFEVVGVNSASTGVVVCEDSRSLADWIRAITNNISALLSHMVSEIETQILIVSEPLPISLIFSL